MHFTVIQIIIMFLIGYVPLLTDRQGYEVHRTLCYGQSVRTVQRSRSNDKNGRCSSWYCKIKRGEEQCLGET